MQRIIVIGIPGAGKSTFARKLGERLDLPVHHLDRYFWNPGWKASPRDVFNERLQELLETDRWILDGNYRRTIPLRLEYADTAVLLDLPRRTAMTRVFKRIVTYRNGGRPDMAEECPERWFDRDFINYIWRYDRDVHPEVLEYLAAFESDGGSVIRLAGDQAPERWLNTLSTERVPG
jgi:adenylate kinase family enzyme